MNIPPDVRARREKDALRKRRARYDETVSNRNVEATRAREILQVELSRMREDAVQESSLIREQAIDEARQIRNHAMVESEAIFRNALRRLGNGIMQSRSHDLLDQAKITAQELVREAHLEAYALIEEAKAASLEAESNAADIVAHARSRAGEIETQVLQNARDNEETVPDLVERTRTRRERDAARKRRVNCPNKRYTGDWKLENVHPLKLTDVSAYAEELGADLGQATDWGEGSIADLVEVGEFFAVEAETPNEFNADFWIMQCSKPLYQLEEDETDDYGNIVYSRDFALHAIWYQQCGRRGTCFIRYGASPESIVRAQDVIHIKLCNPLEQSAVVPRLH
ncbi:hypothetical protein R1sor_015255 [Riccia sorocarpa]|uniref:Uncharacterized protein n=1 Tax=Riccia sorocarpa TaxID=122646 RepID=A0ABD3HFZ8_9MARC